jgi:hypothetical protein
VSIGDAAILFGGNLLALLIGALGCYWVRRLEARGK